MRASLSDKNVLALGVEIGGTKLQVGLGNADGELLLLHTGRVPEGADAEGIRAWLRKGIDAVLAEAESKGHARPARLGVGFGGPVDATQGLTLISHQVAGWERYPLRAWLESAFPGMRV